ncbi:hypothetical protein D5282_00370 [bacterium 1xD8-48]|nr:hypothetical protein [bacterium 1xD8-48]
MIKDKLYDFFVRKNGRVWYEYERYVREHIQEHYLHRFRHIKLLIKLNWFYRVKRGNTPYIYWDEPLNKAEEIEKQTIYDDKEKQIEGISCNISNAFIGSESNEIKKSNCRPSLSRVMYSMRNTRLASFDIFDTLLLRPFADPKDLFYILGEKFGEMDFYNLRIRCEKEARDLKEEMTGSREVTIYDIYERIHFYTDLDINFGVNMEFGLEMDLIYPNKYQKYIFDTFLNNHIPVILISDMYYPMGMMEKILMKNNICGYEKLYISCDKKCSKESGDLFEYAINDYPDVPKDMITHIDDNWRVILKAREKGITAIHYVKNIALTNKYRPHYMSAMAGSAYKGIVGNYLAANESRFSVPYEYGFIYGGILALGYCSYIHNICIDKGINKVLFMSRDGDILKQTWDFLYDDIQSDYILVSRTCAMRLAADIWKKIFMECAVDRMITKKRPVTIEQALEQCGLGNLICELEKYSLSKDMMLSKEQNTAILSQYKVFLNNNMKKVVDEYKESNEIYEKYLSTLIDKEKKIALVDIGWRGVNGATLERVIKKISPNIEVNNFLVGGRQPVNLPQIRKGKIFCYLFSAEKNYGILQRHKEKTNFYYELLTMSPTSSFQYFYYDKNKNIRMKGSEVIPDNYVTVSEIQQGILDFVKEYTMRFKKYKELYNIPSDDVAQVLYNIMDSDEYFKKYFYNIHYSPQLESEKNISFGEWI